MNNIAYAPILDIVLSVDSNEWYYGRKANIRNEEKRILVTSCVPSSATKLEAYATYVNEHFLWMQGHERDTLKRKKRSFYIDRDLFKSEEFRFS